MSIKKIFDDNEKTTLEFDNGDKMKLQEIMNSWKFKDEKSFFRFAMIVFSESSDKKTIAYYDKEQSLIKAQPVDSLIKQDGSSNINNYTSSQKSAIYIFFFITALSLVLLIVVNYNRYIKTLERDKVIAETQKEVEKIKEEQMKIKKQQEADYNLIMSGNLKKN